METLIRCHILRHLIWVCTVCQLPVSASPVFNGLEVPHPQHMFSWRNNGKYYVDTPLIWGCGKGTDQQAVAQSDKNHSCASIYSTISSESVCTQRRFWSDFANTQADLGFRCLHTCIFLRSQRYICTWSGLFAFEIISFESSHGKHMKLNPCPAEPRYTLPLQTVYMYIVDPDQLASEGQLIWIYTVCH